MPALSGAGLLLAKLALRARASHSSPLRQAVYKLSERWRVAQHLRAADTQTVDGLFGQGERRRQILQIFAKHRIRDAFESSRRRP
jgi:hypothetical protein